MQATSIGLGQINFNSNMVWLKVGLTSDDVDLIMDFNSNMVWLKDKREITGFNIS